MEVTTSEYSSKFFKFDIVDLKDTCNIRFYQASGSNILVVFVKDGNLYLSVSYNHGEGFDEPQKVMDIAGEVKDIQILSKGNQFVIAILERISDQDRKRTITGYINNEKQTFFFRLCPKQEVKGEIMNISLSFREYRSGVYESVDHIFYRNRGQVCVHSMGHG